MKVAKLGYSIFAYAFFLGVFNYLVIFLGGSFLQEWVPLLSVLKTVDEGASFLTLPFLPAWLGNFILLLVFSVHHSVMARSGIKKIITRVIPESAERSTFVLVTCVLLAWMFLAWQPQTATVWHVDGAVAIGLTISFLMGAGLVLWSTFMISHWQLFGLAQAWNEFRGIAPTPDEFGTPALYKYSRHPMYVGILTVMWSTPHMTSGHLMLAAVWTLYVFIGIYFEERDLIRQFGQRYLDYQERVSKLLPFKLVTRSIRPARNRDARTH